MSRLAGFFDEGVEIEQVGAGVDVPALRSAAAAMPHRPAEHQSVSTSTGAAMTPIIRL